MSGQRSHPLSSSDIDALFAPFVRAKALLIAVSGGPDSTALLLMAAEWAKQRGRTRIEAATVDHALRAGSADEAKAVAALCGRLKVGHRVLQWKGAKPTTRVQERAREARYRLLVEHAKAIGADAVLTAHHADDQAETVLFRLLRGSGIAGLRGMDRVTVRDGMTIGRPLMRLKKRDLITFVNARRAPFIDDPSNTDPRFARTRLRALLARLGEEGLDAEALDRLARRARETEEALAHLTAEVELRVSSESGIDARALFTAPIAIAHRILARRIADVGGRDASRIGLEKIEALAASLRDAFKERRAHSANIGGALVRLSAKGRLTLAPEPPRRSGAR
ncbi:MAG TPA: tRNA lysidine(34) synthetase TilS [Roseiarcus sp.]|nr:tRNA lysidine(34) synthetase TilS [Roseiarcus sp.]